MAVKFIFTGYPAHRFNTIVGRVTLEPLPVAERANAILVWLRPEPPSDIFGYAGVLTSGDADGPVPIIAQCADLSEAEAGSIVQMDGHGFVRVLYRPNSSHNAIFATGRCNSNCIMCPQPPARKEDAEGLTRIFKMLSLIETPPKTMGITGGEPTLLGEDLIEIITTLKEKMPHTAVHLLTNGRSFNDPGFVVNIADIHHEHLTLGIPLYADTAARHDWIVQTRGAFDQTINGLYNLAHYGIHVEIRVVLHK